MDADGCPRTVPYYLRILLCYFLHKIILVFLHFLLLWYAYTVYKLSDDLTKDLESMEFFMGELNDNTVILEAVAIILAVVTILFGIPALVTGIRILLRLHMFLLTVVTWFLAIFLLAWYKGNNSETIAEVNARYTTSFENARDRQDIEGINYVMKIERYLKCCGYNSSKDYRVWVMESCCDTNPPCLAKDVHKIGCGEANEMRLARPFSLLVSVTSDALIFMVCILVYLFFYAYLLYRRRCYKPKAASKTASETIEVV